MEKKALKKEEEDIKKLQLLRNILEYSLEELQEIEKEKEKQIEEEQKPIEEPKPIDNNEIKEDLPLVNDIINPETNVDIKPEEIKKDEEIEIEDIDTNKKKEEENPEEKIQENKEDNIENNVLIPLKDQIEYKEEKNEKSKENKLPPL